jgi:hypothetical protein
MILSIADDLVLRIKAWGVTVDFIFGIGSMPSQRMLYTVLDVLESRRDEDPPDGSGCENSRDQVRKASGNAGHSAARRRESKFIDDHVAGFIDDHVAGADKPGGVADRRDCELQQ